MKFKEKLANLKCKTQQVYIAFKSKKTPWYAKIMALITIGYALSPVDLVPDFIPILGYLDDLLILPILIWLTIKLIPKELWLSFEEEAKEIWQDGKPKKWYFAIPIIIIWIIVITLIIFLILKVGTK